MIFHHTANKDIEAYLTTLLKTDVIRNLITAVVEFNTDQADALDKLLSAEQMEMEMLALKDDATAATATATAAAPRTHDDKSSASTPPEGHVAQTSQPQSKGPNRFLRFLKCLFCGCCHRRRRESDKRRDSSIILDEIEPSTTVKQSEEVMPDDVPRVVVVVVVDESHAEVDTLPLPESDSLPPNTGNA